MDTQENFLLSRPPTADRPLLGLTVLLVEDSRFACEAIRMMATRSGARLRRADCLTSARQHLRTYRPSVALIDLGLPDGYGEDLIADLSRATPRIGAILATSADPDGEMRAKMSGADGFIAKPIHNIAAFQAKLLEHVPANRRPRGPRPVTNAQIQPDTLAYHDDLIQIARMIAGGPDPRELDYICQFLNGVADAAGDQTILQSVKTIHKTRHANQPIQPMLRDLSDAIELRLLQQPHNSLG